jgi:hypothetical protein
MKMIRIATTLRQSLSGERLKCRLNFDTALM